MPTILNKTYDEIAIGDAAWAQRRLMPGDLRAWAAAFGDIDLITNPGASQSAAGIVSALLTALAGSALRGPGASVRAISVQMKGALPLDAEMTSQLVVQEKRGDEGIVILDGLCADLAGRIVATAQLEVMADKNGY